MLCNIFTARRSILREERGTVYNRNVFNRNVFNRAVFNLYAASLQGYITVQAARDARTINSITLPTFQEI